VAEKLQEIVGGGKPANDHWLPGIPHRAGLLDWLKATNQPFNLAKVIQ
jgi:hypothetical protein